MEQQTILLSEPEAVRAFGLKSSTLKRFSETGYLGCTITPSGVSLFAFDELSRLFGQPVPGFRLDYSAAPLRAAQPQVAEPETPFSPEYTDNDVKEQVGPISSIAAVSIAGDLFEADPDTLYKSARWSTAPAGINSLAGSSQQTLAEKIKALESTITSRQELIEAKTQELTDLKAHREWLRSLVLKLEERAEREQLLLLSETQVVARLLQGPTASGATEGFLLEWLQQRSNGKLETQAAA